MRPREREGGAAKRERERRDAAKREKEERGGAGRERESRRLGFLISGESLQGFASRFLMREKEVEACFYKGKKGENPRIF